MIRSVLPLPKPRVTRRSCGPGRPQEAQSALDEVDGNDVEDARKPDFGDDLDFTVVERAASDDNFRFIGFLVFLSFDAVARKDDIFEVEDREDIIFQFFRSVERYYISQRANKIADPSDGRRWHSIILLERLMVAKRLR